MQRADLGLPSLSADASPTAVNTNIKPSDEASPPTVISPFAIIPPQVINMVVGYLTPQQAFQFLMHTCATLRNRTLTWSNLQALSLNDGGAIKILDKKTIYYAVSGVSYNGLSYCGSDQPSTEEINKSFKDMVFVFEDRNNAEEFKSASNIYSDYGSRLHFVKPCKIVGSEKSNQLFALKVNKIVRPNVRYANGALKNSFIVFSIFRASGNALTYLKEEPAPAKAVKS